MDGLLVAHEWLSKNAPPRRVAGLALIITLASVGCASTPNEGQSGETTDTESESASSQPSTGLATYPSDGSEGGDTALLEGILRSENDCLFIQTVDGGSVIPIFPTGMASWDGGTLVVSHADEASSDEYAVGDADLALTGGFTTGSLDSYSVPSTCPTEYSYFLVANI